MRQRTWTFFTTTSCIASCMVDETNANSSFCLVICMWMNNKLACRKQRVNQSVQKKVPVVRYVKFSSVYFNYFSMLGCHGVMTLVFCCYFGHRALTEDICSTIFAYGAVVSKQPLFSCVCQILRIFWASVVLCKYVLRDLEQINMLRLA